MSKQYNRYTIEEVEYIKENYTKITVVEIAKYLGRSSSIIRSKLKNMGLRGISSTHHLTSFELDFIKQNYNKLSNDNIAKILKLKRRAVEGGMHKIGIRRKLNISLKKQFYIYCSICKNKYEKTKDNFYFLRSNKNILHSSICKKCSKDKARKHTSILDNYIKMLLRGIRDNIYRKNKCNMKYNLDFEYIKNLYKYQNGKCNITGLPMTSTQNGGRCMTNISIDRIDNYIGYIKGNIQLVCTWANLAKISLSMNEFKYFIDATNDNLNKKYYATG